MLEESKGNGREKILKILKDDGSRKEGIKKLQKKRIERKQKWEIKKSDRKRWRGEQKINRRRMDKR